MTSRIAVQRSASETKPSYPERGIAKKDRTPPVDQTPQVAERRASAGARSGVKGKRTDLAARAPLHALVRLRRAEKPMQYRQDAVIGTTKVSNLKAWSDALKGGVLKGEYVMPPVGMQRRVVARVNAIHYLQ